MSYSTSNKTGTTSGLSLINWGKLTNNNTSTTTTKYHNVSLNLSFSNKNYTFLRTTNFDSQNADKAYAYTGSWKDGTNKTVSGLQCINCYASYASTSSWIAIGY